MRKISFILVAALISAMPMNAQLFQTIGQAVKDAKKEQPKQQAQQQPAQQSQTKQSSGIQENKGKIYYVSANGKGRGADGLSPENAKKDIQAVLNTIKDNNENGAIVRVSEGNFLGQANAGYI
jgi:ribosomal protein S9